MNYRYAIACTITQHLDRQIDELNKAGLLNSQIFIDKKSEKYFNRTNYKKNSWKNKIRRCFICKFDRLACNYNMILDEWKSLLKKRTLISLL